MRMRAAHHLPGNGDKQPKVSGSGGLKGPFRCDNALLASVASTIIGLLAVYVVYSLFSTLILAFLCNVGFTSQCLGLTSSSSSSSHGGGRSSMTAHESSGGNLALSGDDSHAGGGGHHRADFSPYYNGDIKVDHGASRGYLVVRTIGEVGNHMECLLTAVVAASLLNLTLVEPAVFPVYHQKHLDLSEAYDEPWSDVDTAEAKEYPLSRMFAQQPYRALANLPREHYGTKMVDALPDGLKKTTLGIPEHTWEMSTKNGEKLNATVVDWLNKMDDNEKRNADAIDKFVRKARVDGDESPTLPLYYESGTSLCFYALNPKYDETCEAMGCRHIVDALQPSDVVKAMADKVLAYITKQRTDARRPKWFAMHFVHPQCKPGVEKYNEHLGTFLDTYVDTVHPSGRNTLYVISEDWTKKFRVALHRYHFDVVTIEDVFPDAYAKYPFNVLAQVDFEVALRSDVYFGRPFAALDLWIEQRKAMAVDDGRNGYGEAVFYGDKKPCASDWS